jgi:hypothetical protein
MALPQLEHYLYRLKTTPALQQAFLADRDGHLANESLDAEERQALVAGDVESLWRMGVHPMLMAPLGRLYGLKPADYRARLRPLAGERLLRSST